MSPWIQFRVANDTEDACDCEVVSPACFCVRWVAIELAQRVSRGGYERAERDDWLLLLFDQRAIDYLGCDPIRV